MVEAVKLEIVKILFLGLSTDMYTYTEEDLRMAISEKIGELALKGSSIEDKTDERIIENGAWVYKYSGDGKWIFERYNTIEDAVRRAICLIDAQVICNGGIVKYDSFNEREAYYVDDYTGELKFVAERA